MKRPNKQQRKLAKVIVNVALKPGEPLHPVSALEALASAENYLQQRDYGAAGQICAQLINGSKLEVEPYVIMLRVAIEMDRALEALNLSEKLLELGVKEAYDAEVVSQGLKMANRHRSAIDLLTTAIKKNPANYALYKRRASLLADLGEIDAAVEDLRRVIQLQPRHYAAYCELANLTSLTREEIATLERARPTSKSSASAYFALAAVNSRSGNIDDECHYLQLANAAMDERFDGDPSEEEQRSNTLLELFNQEYADKFKPPGDLNSRPVFIIGMPRSGSTLTEQILANHEDVGAAGESSIFETVLHDLARARHPKHGWPDILHALTDSDLVYIRREYLDGIAEVFTRASVFVDKTLNHYRYVGLMALAFPDARFVHTLRHPMATCLSCYQQPFDDMQFSSDLNHIAFTYLDHLRIMKRWQTLFGDRIITIEYEELVTNPETKARELLEFCEIPWSNSVLEFYRNDKPVQTASRAQIRQPIFKTSVDTWRQYAELLEPARRLLEPELGPF